MNEQTYYAAPVAQLKTNRGMLKMILLGLITFGIYPLVIWTCMSGDINVIASRYDGKKTMNYCLLTFIVVPITLGIGGIVWTHRFCARVGNELKRRGISYSFGAGTFWGWGVLGSLLFGIGSFVYLHKVCKAMNLLAADYNVKG